MKQLLNSVTNKSVMVFGGAMEIVYRAVHEDTQGHYSLYEITCEPGNGPPLHTHSDVDEAFYVVDGMFRIQVGDEHFKGSAGWFGFGPRNVKHAFTACGSTPAKILVVVSPAGLEDFFAELSSLTSTEPADSPNVTALFEKHGMKIVGPPLEKDMNSQGKGLPTW